MIEQIGNGLTVRAVMPDATSVTVNVRGPGGTIVTGAVATQPDAVNLPDLWEYTVVAGNVTSEGLYVARFVPDSGDDQYAQWYVGVAGVENLDAAVSTRATPADVPSAATIATAVWNVLTSALTTAGSIGKYILDQLARIGSGQVVTVAPVATSGDVLTKQGNDYYAADGRELAWTDAAATWPELTSAAIAVIIKGVVSLVGSVVTATGDNKEIRLELSAAETAAIPAGTYPFVAVATLSNGHTVDLVAGTWASREQLAV